MSISAEIVAIDRGPSRNALESWVSQLGSMMREYIEEWGPEEWTALPNLKVHIAQR
jgi:hypothetical protein